MATLSDIRFEKLRALGYIGSISDMTLAWLQDNGATSNQISDAWVEVLDSFPLGLTGSRNDKWFELLGLVGYSGSLNDRELAFWSGPVNGPELIVNGNFATSANWVFNASFWTVGSGVASAVAAPGALYQNSTGIFTTGKTYQVSFTISGYSAGTIRPAFVGSTPNDVGTYRSANGDYTDSIAIAQASVSSFRLLPGTAFTGAISNVSVREVA